MIILVINKETSEVVLLKCCSVSYKGHIGKATDQDGAYPISRKIRKDVGEGNLNIHCGMN